MCIRDSIDTARATPRIQRRTLASYLIQIAMLAIRNVFACAKVPRSLKHPTRHKTRLAIVKHVAPQEGLLVDLSLIHI